MFLPVYQDSLVYESSSDNFFGTTLWNVLLSFNQSWKGNIGPFRPPPPYLNDYTNVVSFSQLTANHPSQNELKGDGISVQPVRKRVEAFISQDLMGHSCKSSLRLTRVLFLLDSWVEGVGGAWSVEDERERKGNFCY